MRIVLFPIQRCVVDYYYGMIFVSHFRRRRRRFGCLDNFRHFKTRDLFEEEQPPRRKEK